MRTAMAVLEGVLAIHKPPSISSYDVIRTVTPLFRASPLFQPLIERDRARMLSSLGPGKHKSKSKQRLGELKIGHGGTLDPLATGVLVVGIGKGTKSLQGFLNGSKEYECTLLFGAATDSYDVLGKVTETVPWEHVTKEAVEEALEKFKGPIMQAPPIFSAKKVDGKKMYDVARGDGPKPELKKVQVTVHELELLEWLPPDKHTYDLPSQEAEAVAKLAAERKEWTKSLLHKRKREDDSQTAAEREPPQKMQRASPTSPVEGEINPNETTDLSDPSNAETQTTDTNVPTKNPVPRPSAARLRMKVSSGFYVRSLCHDLAKSVGSAGVMATLVRSRQSGFKLGENVIEFEAFERGSEAWEPQVKGLLEQWQEEHPESGEGEVVHGERNQGQKRRYEGQRGRGGGKGRKGDWGQDSDRRRRNTSSEPDS